jgi:hypothetical protein
LGCAVGIRIVIRTTGLKTRLGLYLCGEFIRVVSGCISPFLRYIVSSFDTSVNGSFSDTLVHVTLAIRPQAYRYCDAAELAQLHEQGSPFTVLVTIGLALMFAAWGAYTLSGAGVIRQLPLMRTVLIAIGAIYILRSFMLPSELVKVLTSGYPFRFVVFSTGSLAIGLLYLVGTLAR